LRRLVVVLVLIFGSLVHAGAKDVGTCEGEAAKVVLATASQYEKIESKKAGRAPSKLKVEKVKNTLIDAGDTFYDKYILQAYRFSEDSNKWVPAAGRPAQVVFSYDLEDGPKSKTICSLSYFSYLSYTFETYDSFGE
jgi:hypothetical protein